MATCRSLPVPTNLTSALVVREGASNQDSYSFSVTISFPLLDWFDDSLRHPEHFVDFAVDLLRLAVAADCQAGFSLGTGQADGEHLMGGKLLAEGGPRSVYAGVQERSLNANQQMISQHAKEDVGLNPALQVMKNGPFHQWAFHAAESRLDSRQQDVGAPHFFMAQIKPTAF